MSKHKLELVECSFQEILFVTDRRP